MIELNEQQQQAVEDQGHLPLEVVNPATQEVYLLVRKEAYARLASLLADDDPTGGMILMNEVMADVDANDPLLESYQRYAQ